MSFFDPLLLPVPLIFACLLLGLLVGSFLNVVIYRLPKMMEREWEAQCKAYQDVPIEESEPFNLALPRSHCPTCGHTLSLLNNIPLLSYLLQKGRCRYCAVGISPRYPLVEALTGTLFALAAWMMGPKAALLGALVFIAALVALTFIDLDTFLLPDSITLPLLWLGLALNLTSTYTDLQSAVIGAIAGYGLLWLVYWGFKFATGKEGMGYGDFKLLAAIGAWLGWQVLPMVVLASSIVGVIAGSAMMVTGRLERANPIPFGPYLAAAGLIALFIGRDTSMAFFGF
ncbi:MAG: type fimbrial biosis protein prepilin cysteine protease [Pseudomonadota bacterium]|jgi:leader peptidase (prepilin peptidase)/N-methyltransferase